MAWWQYSWGGYPPSFLRKIRETQPITFHDAFEAGQACEHLEESGIEFELKDISEPQEGIRSFSSPPIVMLQLFVNQSNEERVKGILRERMNLFPLQEVAVADEPIDDGTIADLGYFGLRGEAEEVAYVLKDAGVWHRIVADPDGTIEDQDCYTLEVKEIDAVRAGELIEKVLNMPKE